MTTKVFNELLAKYSPELVTVFSREEDEFIFIGYPVVRAFVKAGPYCIETMPSVDVKSRVIHLSSGGGKTKNVDTLKALQPELQEENKKKQEQFFCTIPTEVLCVVLKFPDSHWQILKAISNCGGRFEQLAATNAALAYIAVNLEMFTPAYSLYNSVNLVGRLTLAKRKDILVKAGFPATDGMLNLLKMIDPLSINVRKLMFVREHLNSRSDASEKAFALLRSLPAAAADFYELFYSHVSSIELISLAGLKQLARHHRRRELVVVLHAVQLLRNQLKIQIPEINSVDKLLEVHGYLQEEKIRREGFPPPPVKGCQFVEPIRNVEEQIQWAKRQGNCIRTFIRDVQRGRCYFYRVMANGEEGTLELKLTNKGVIAGSLLGYKNAKLSRKTHELVMRWLEQALVPSSTNKKNS